VPRAAGDLHRESSSASHQSRATNRVPRTFHYTFHSISTPQVSLGCPFDEPGAAHVPQQHLNPTGLVGLPFWQPNGTSQAATSTMGSRAPPDSSACKGGTPSVAISMPSLHNGKPSSIAVTLEGYVPLLGSVRRVRLYSGGLLGGRVLRSIILRRVSRLAFRLALRLAPHAGSQAGPQAGPQAGSQAGSQAWCSRRVSLLHPRLKRPQARALTREAMHRP
jgi:hypothetical protein